MYGFIPDMFKLFKQYKLEDYFKNYIQTKVFPTNLVWKRTVSNAINSLATSERLSRMEQDSDFTRFWTSILDIFGIQTFIYPDTLYSSSTEELLYILLGGVQNLTTNCPDIEDDVYIRL